ncbi:hypothetical protein L1987_16008 [Smallanthus sonchifolius]|uniref:Uncharacterized protein n=1 Tax=Smallanthus sonchifolius TaxID=185202 RepID=A0ACB9J7P6_9ASTR|nr:hypothetical protein L1987_16008 [Smallanthus sonchifolius]
MIRPLVYHTAGEIKIRKLCARQKEKKNHVFLRKNCVLETVLRVLKEGEEFKLELAIDHDGEEQRKDRNRDKDQDKYHEKDRANSQGGYKCESYWVRKVSRIRIDCWHNSDHID